MKDKQVAAVEAIIKDLSDRRGLSGAWDEIDDDVKEEIKQTWVTIIGKKLYPK